MQDKSKKNLTIDGSNFQGFGSMDYDENNLIDSEQNFDNNIRAGKIKGHSISNSNRNQNLVTRKKHRHKKNFSLSGPLDLGNIYGLKYKKSSKNGNFHKKNAKFFKNTNLTEVNLEIEKDSTMNLHSVTNLNVNNNSESNLNAFLNNYANLNEDRSLSNEDQKNALNNYNYNNNIPVSKMSSLKKRIDNIDSKVKPKNTYEKNLSNKSLYKNNIELNNAKTKT